MCHSTLDYGIHDPRSAKKTSKTDQDGTIYYDIVDIVGERHIDGVIRVNVRHVGMGGGSSHLQEGRRCVMDGQNVGDVVLRQQLLISCICQSEQTLRSGTFAPSNLHSGLMNDQH